MLNGEVQSVNDANEKNRQTLQPYQFLWLARWKGTDCDAARETSSLNAYVSEELDCVPRKNGSTKGLEAYSRPINGLGSIEYRNSEIGDDFIKEARKRVGKEKMFSSMFKDGQYADDVHALSPELAQNIESSKAVHNRIGIPSSGCHSVEEDTSDSPPKLTRTCSARKDSLFRFVESSSLSLPYKFAFEVEKFDEGKAAMSVGSKHNRADMRMLESKQFAQSGNTSDECFRGSSSCDHNLKSKTNRGWFMEMQRPSAPNSTASAKTSKTVSNEVVPGHRNNKPKVKYNSGVDEFRNADGGNRWVKRLKLSSSNSCIQGSKSSTIYSNLYHEERSKLSGDIPKSKTTTSRPNTENHHCEKPVKSIETADEKGKALLVLHGWIQRWKRIKSKEKSEVEKFQRGEFPSIAAMALMSKALTCFQQCELQKKGCCTIWNTKRL